MKHFAIGENTGTYGCLPKLEVDLKDDRGRGLSEHLDSLLGRSLIRHGKHK